MKIGATYHDDDSCEFVVWAPYHNKVDLILTRREEKLPMEKIEDGHWIINLKDLEAGTEYKYQIDNGVIKPDPASHFQPQGVFGPSATVDHKNFVWKDEGWCTPKLSDLVLYELHVGTFSRKGTFEAIQDRIKELADFGVNALEFMPITQFSGERNWGYDSVFPFAVHNTYGGPIELKKLIDSCHLNGVAAVLDVIYNHVGPEGNCFREFGPYFLDNRRTPWGSSINFDGPDCSPVRKYFLENAIYWFQNYHVDALRLDAVHAIMDNSRKHIIKEIAEETSRYIRGGHRKVYLIAETNQNDPIVVRSQKAGGYGLDAQWLDDFHHALHALITGERKGYYVDFGNLNDLVKALNEGFVYTGQYSRFFESCRGLSAKDVPPNKFVDFSQNHDQIGNRALGERLIALAGLEAAKVAAAIVILSPYIPLLFMGEEYGEKSPFLYFTSFSDQKLGENVRKGRAEEHKEEAPPSEIPDPQSVKTFNQSKINWQKRKYGKGKKICCYYRELLRIRRQILSKSIDQNMRMEVSATKEKCLLTMHKEKIMVIANFSRQEREVCFDFREANFVKTLDSADAAWAGPGSSLPEKPVFGKRYTVQPLNAAVYVKSA